VAVGGELVNNKALREGKLEVITSKARQFVEAVRAARAAMKK
jgi:2-keto-3-deoxy-6-phosphogluconate aldolase